MKASFDKYFVVFGGPNGAGKSFASKTFLENLGLPISAFNWDARFQQLWSEFGSDPLVIEGVRDKINSEFKRYIDNSLERSLSASYETNFHLDHNIDLITRAKNHGYIVILYFLYLESVEIATARVAKRVKLGGHDVGEQDMIERYVNGFIQLNKAIPLCDFASIYDYSNDYEATLIISKSPNKFSVHRKIPRKLFEKVPCLSEYGVTEALVKSNG